MLDISGCGDVGDGTETGLVGEHSSLQTDDDDASDGSSHDAGRLEGVLEDHGERVADSIDVHDDGDEREDDPCDGHDGDDGGGELGDPLESLEDDEGGHCGDDDREHVVVVVEFERSAERVGCVACLDGDESDSEGEDQEYGCEVSYLLVAETFGGVVGGAAVEVAVLLLLLVDLGEGGFHEAAGGSDDGEDPHPKHGTGTSGDDGGRNSRDVTDADTGAHSDTERFE